nr:hypothetical protein [Propionicimonas sp.]
MGEDAGDGLGWHEGGVFVLVDDDSGEQGAVEDAAFSGFALGVEVAGVGEDVGDVVESLAGAAVGGGEGVEPAGDLVEAGADAVLFGLEQVEGDRVGVVGLDEFEAFGFELVALGGQDGAFVAAGGFELVEHLAQHGADVCGFVGGESVAAVGGLDAVLDPGGEDRAAGAAVLAAAP